jgi:hypothetical protein
MAAGHDRRQARVAGRLAGTLPRDLGVFRLIVQQRPEIAAVMGDTQDQDILTHDPIHNYISPDGKTSCAGAQITVSWTANAWSSGQQVKPIRDRIDLTVGNVVASTLLIQILPNIV